MIVTHRYRSSTPNGPSIEPEQLGAIVLIILCIFVALLL